MIKIKKVESKKNKMIRVISLNPCILLLFAQGGLFHSKGFLVTNEFFFEEEVKDSNGVVIGSILQELILLIYIDWFCESGVKGSELVDSKVVLKHRYLPFYIVIRFESRNPLFPNVSLGYRCSEKGLLRNIKSTKISFDGGADVIAKVVNDFFIKNVDDAVSVVNVDKAEYYRKKSITKRKLEICSHASDVGRGKFLYRGFPDATRGKPSSFSFYCEYSGNKVCDISYSNDHNSWSISLEGINDEKIKKIIDILAD